MKYIVNTLIVVIILFFSCDRARDHNPNYQDFVSHMVPGTLSYYCGLDHLSLEKINDSNSLFFSRQGMGPIMYSLMIKKNENNIKAIYHWNNSMNVGDTIYFQGFSFQIDSTSWNDLTKKANQLLEKTNPDSFSDGVTGGTYFVLTRDGKSVIVNRSPMLNEFREFSEYLIKSIIEPVEKLRTKTSFDTPNPNI